LLSAVVVLVLALGVTTYVWVLVMQQEQGEAYAAVTGATWAGLLVAGIATLVAAGVAFVVARRITTPLADLVQAARRMASGDLNARAPIGRRDEIGELAAAFNALVNELADTVGTVEQRVVERTRGLQAAAEVSQATTAVLDPDELLRRVVDLVRERFDLYYVGLFLLDEASSDSGRTFAVLRAGTGQAGQEMLAQGHRLEVGGDSMIGQCVARSEARIALDVGEEAVRFDNPLLPDTRSELALPLRSRGRVVGAMTVQSVAEAAFDEAYIAILQTMADQVAVAIDNARLFARTQAALQEAEDTHRRYLGQAWAEYLQKVEVTSYEAERPGLPPADDTLRSAIRQAVERQSATARQETRDDQEHPAREDASSPTLVAPITLRGGEVIGALGIHDAQRRRQWTVEEMALVEAITERLALAAERLRLFDETQRRVAQEQIIRQITEQMQRAADVESILRFTATQLGEVTGAPRTYIRLGTEAELQAGDGRNQAPPAPEEPTRGHQEE
jgi:GAF domain-containing protein/HAMP domain-containing protein